MRRDITSFVSTQREKMKTAIHTLEDKKEELELEKLVVDLFLYVEELEMVVG